MSLLIPLHFWAFYPSSLFYHFIISFINSSHFLSISSFLNKFLTLLSTLYPHPFPFQFSNFGSLSILFSFSHLCVLIKLCLHFLLFTPLLFLKGGQGFIVTERRRFIQMQLVTSLHTLTHIPDMQNKDIQRTPNDPDLNIFDFNL